MKRIYFVLVSLLLISLTACGRQIDKTIQSNEVSQSTSVQIETEESDKELPYQRVIAGTSSVAEYLAEFEIPVVGVTDQDGIPTMYNDSERVGQPRQLNMEKVVSLEPDLFIGDQALAELSQQAMADQSIETVYLNNSSYEGILTSIEQIGKIFHKEDQAKEIVADLQKQERDALSGIEKLKGKKLAVLFGTGESYKLATKNSYLGSLLEKLGVDNVADKITQAPRPYVDFSLETVVAENPDYILTLAHGHKEQAAQAFKAEMQKELWQQTTAVQENHTYALDDKTYPVTGNIHVIDTLANLKNLLLDGSPE